MNEDIIRQEILQGLLQVDSTFIITEFSIIPLPEKRTLKVLFTAQNEAGNEVKGVKEYA
jgi:hypothetical protein